MHHLLVYTNTWHTQQLILIFFFFFLFISLIYIKTERIQDFHQQVVSTLNFSTKKILETHWKPNPYKKNIGNPTLKQRISWQDYSYNFFQIQKIKRGKKNWPFFGYKNYYFCLLKKLRKIQLIQQCIILILIINLTASITNLK